MYNNGIPVKHSVPGKKSGDGFTPPHPSPVQPWKKWEDGFPPNPSPLHHWKKRDNVKRRHTAVAVFHASQYSGGPWPTLVCKHLSSHLAPMILWLSHDWFLLLTNHRRLHCSSWSSCINIVVVRSSLWGRHVGGLVVILTGYWHGVRMMVVTHVAVPIHSSLHLHAEHTTLVTSSTQQLHLSWGKQVEHLL